MPLPTRSAASTTPPSLPSAATLAALPLFTAASHPSRWSVPSATPPAASIATLLDSLPSHSTTTPLSVTPAASLKASPLILSPALPPIPTKLVEKILKGENLELKELLPDNVALQKKLDEVNIGSNQVCALPSSSHLRDISDPLSWVFCYLSFMTVKTPNQETCNLIAYAQIIIELARKHPGLWWYTDDNLFCQQLNAGAGVKWNEVNPLLMAATVLASRGWKAVGYAHIVWPQIILLTSVP